MKDPSSRQCCPRFEMGSGINDPHRASRASNQPPEIPARVSGRVCRIKLSVPLLPAPRTSVPEASRILKVHLTALYRTMEAGKTLNSTRARYTPKWHLVTRLLSLGPNGEIFDSLKKAKVVIEQCCHHDNTVKPGVLRDDPL
jgi:hypothetical protein